MLFFLDKNTSRFTLYKGTKRRFADSTMVPKSQSLHHIIRSEASTVLRAPEELRTVLRVEELGTVLRMYYWTGKLHRARCC